MEQKQVTFEQALGDMAKVLSKIGVQLNDAGAEAQRQFDELQKLAETLKAENDALKESRPPVDDDMK